MASGHSATVLEFIRALGERGQAASIPDRELLERFVSRRDEGAFTALVRRHGPMVLGLCRRILQNEQDAEDALQAVFLVLSRKAGTLRRQDSVASWLYGVAYRLAVKAKRKADCRRAHERCAASRSPRDPSTEFSLREAQAILDKALAQLPDSLRSPLVLCYLEGLTRDEAAQRLGCPLGTIKSRLQRARERLGTTLTARGLTLSTALVVSPLLAGATCAAVPEALLRLTVDAATRFAGGAAASAVASKNVSYLVEGVFRAMFISKLKSAVCVLLVFAIAGGMLAVVGASGGGPRGQVELRVKDDPEPRDDKAPKADEGTGVKKPRERAPAKQPRRLTLALKSLNVPENSLSVFVPGTSIGVGGQGTALKVAKDAKVLVDGKEVRLADVKEALATQPRMAVILDLAADGSTVTKIEAIGLHVDGLLYTVAANKNLITLVPQGENPGKYPEYRLEQAEVFIDGGAGKPVDLKAGMPVMVRFEKRRPGLQPLSQALDRVDASAVLENCVVEDVAVSTAEQEPHALTVTIAGTKLRLVGLGVRKDAAVLIDDRFTTPPALRPGMRVSLQIVGGTSSAVVGIRAWRKTPDPRVKMVQLHHLRTVAGGSTWLQPTGTRTE